jgi:hypothetical protein
MGKRSEEAPMENDFSPFDAHAVLAQFYSGQIPATWHIYHARRRSLIGSAVGLLSVALICIALAILDGTSGRSIDDGFLMMMLIAVAGIMALVAAFVLSELRGFSEQVVIVTPAGFLVHTDVTIPVGRLVVPRSFAVAFADLRHLTSTTQGSPAGLVNSLHEALREAISSQETMTAIILDYLDGRHVELRIPARFGWPQPIIKDVLAAYESWQAQQIAVK